MVIAKKPCINDPSYTYTGKESSPLGLGYSANAENVTASMKGRDGTMWRVSMKNGVKVWTRVPTDATSEPLQREEPVIVEETEKPKKKVVRKKKVESEETPSAPEEVQQPEITPVVEEPKKKVTRKKKDDTSSEGEKKPRKPTNFNLFMKYRMKYMDSAGMNHKEKFSKAASEWKAMPQAEKDEIMKKVNEEFGNN